MKTRNEILEALADVYKRHNPTATNNFEANRKFATDRLILELLIDIRDRLEIPEVRIIFKAEPQNIITRKKNRLD